MADKSVVDFILESRDPFVPCAAGEHSWQSIGGRACPHDLTENCSQAVFRCNNCGGYDYGEIGGPGARDCKSRCHSPLVNQSLMTRQMKRKLHREIMKGYKPFGEPKAPADPLVYKVRFRPFGPGQDPEIDERYLLNPRPRR